MELGIYTFVEITPDAVTGGQLNPHQRMRCLMEEIELAAKNWYSHSNNLALNQQCNQFPPGISSSCKGYITGSFLSKMSFQLIILVLK